LNLFTFAAICMAMMLAQYYLFTFCFRESGECKKLYLGRYELIYHAGIKHEIKRDHRYMYDLIIVQARHMISDQGYILRWHHTTIFAGTLFVFRKAKSVPEFKQEMSSIKEEMQRMSKKIEKGEYKRYGKYKDYEQ